MSKLKVFSISIVVLMCLFTLTGGGCGKKNPVCEPDKGLICDPYTCPDGSECPGTKNDDGFYTYQNCCQCATPPDSCKICKCADGVTDCPDKSIGQCSCPVNNRPSGLDCCWCDYEKTTACPDGDKCNCPSPPKYCEICKCANDEVCPDGDPCACTYPPKDRGCCICSDGTACPDNDKCKCSNPPEECTVCKCKDKTTICPDGDACKCAIGNRPTGTTCGDCVNGQFDSDGICTCKPTKDGIQEKSPLYGVCCPEGGAAPEGKIGNCCSDGQSPTTGAKATGCCNNKNGDGGRCPYDGCDSCGVGHCKDGVGDNCSNNQIKN